MASAPVCPGLASSNGQRRHPPLDPFEFLGQSLDLRLGGVGRWRSRQAQAAGVVPPHQPQGIRADVALLGREAIRAEVEGAQVLPVEVTNPEDRAIEGERPELRADARFGGLAEGAGADEQQGQEEAGASHQSSRGVR